MSIEKPTREKSSYWGAAIAALGYFLTQMLSFYFPDADRVVMAIWPAAGVGLAAFLLVPRRGWPLLAFAIFVVGNLANFIVGRNPFLSFGFMGVNLLESWLSALVIIKMSGRTPRFDRLVEVVALAAAAVCVNALTATIAAAIAWTVAGSAPASAWSSWWIGDGLGILIIAPLILALIQKGSIGRFMSLPAFLEGLVFFAIWIAVALSTFNPLEGTWHFAHAHPYFLILLVLWPATHFSTRSIGVATFLLTLIAVTSRSVALGPSPFGGANAVERLQDIELFLAILTFAAYAFSAAFAELRQARKAAETRLAEQKLVEESLKASDERHRAILVGAADGIIVADDRGVFVEINQAGRRILGLDQDKALTMRLADILGPEDLRHLETAASAESDEPPVFCGKSLQRSDGTRVELESRSRKLSSGETICVISDATKRHFEKRLTELRIKLLVADTEAGYADLLGSAIDEAEAVTGSRIGFFHMMGEDREKIALTAWSTNTLGANCKRGVENAHYPIAEAGIWADAARFGRPVIHNDYPSESGRRGLPEGHPDLQRELVVPILREGLVVAIMGVGNKEGPYDEEDIRRVLALGDIAWDVADRKLTRNLLKETEERFSLVFRHSPTPAAISRAETGLYLDVNDAYISLFGYSKGEIIGRTVFELGIYVNLDDRRGFDDIIARRSRIARFESRFRRKNATIIEAIVTAESIFIDGRLYLVSQIEDVTERNLATQKIEKTLAEKDILLRELYHRANNNMQVISALLDFQALSFGDERLSRAIEDTQNRIGALALVNRKLFEAQDLSYIHLDGYIDDLLGVLAQSHSSRQLRMEVKRNLEDIKVIVDMAIPCGLILNELISNVFRHAYPDAVKGQIEIDLKRLPDGRIAMRVADHGVGLPQNFDVDRDGKIGLQNIVGLCTDQLKGSVSFDRTNGLACEVVFADNLYSARV